MYNITEASNILRRYFLSCISFYDLYDDEYLQISRRLGW